VRHESRDGKLLITIHEVLSQTSPGNQKRQMRKVQRHLIGRLQNCHSLSPTHQRNPTGFDLFDAEGSPGRLHHLFPNSSIKSTNSTQNNELYALKAATTARTPPAGIYIILTQPDPAARSRCTAHSMITNAPPRMERLHSKALCRHPRLFYLSLEVCLPGSGVRHNQNRGLLIWPCSRIGILAGELMSVCGVFSSKRPAEFGRAGKADDSS
jgi:hypothetical protein